ncbi:flagellar biosynthesis anti-sigma factor FlgM [Aeromonas sp. FDAARGOS 1416]|uniref:flagellar biosynthesis anti-sigma factor FlgM n=1 Tax=Aeromonas TaxID=642 RepID=UPI001C2226D2|nr:flagellar biosynthesis anti-sigma factor FlgM [Aeromonas sp. FDAARGOS 1416]QXB00776.1 flagellar biosynthesis anti-sigma factor FlgM [Aeromonas sp. FDAARGOS 1416]HDX8360908.1 flagellar biosynthesis anti-sigma factor FlgM [Aeromonas veronii]
MKITRTDPLYIQNQSGRKPDVTAKPETKSSQSSEARISSTAQSVANARSQLATTSDIDMDKVNEIRKAISEGKLEIDLDALGQAILDMHRR